MCIIVDMAGTSTRQYNLRSGKQETLQFPVQLQLEDSKFLAQLLKQQNGQVSDSESSISESDCEALIASDQDSYVGSVKTSSPKEKVVTSAESSIVNQEAINIKILSQLEKLGKRLDSIETNVNKSSGTKVHSKKAKRKVDSSATMSPSSQVPQIPDLNALRQDMSVQALVEQRLRQLADTEQKGTKIKSLRGGSVEVLVPNRVKWPHEFVLSGSSKERVSYDQLSITQWVAGFYRIMKEEKNSKFKEHMLDYMISLFEDANDFSWDAAKASHAVLLCRMEQGEISDYGQTDKIDRIRRANAQRHNVQTNASQSSKKVGPKHAKSMTCNYFNAGSCSHTRTHETRGVVYKHVCSACFANGKSFAHPEIECRSKSKKHSKNE